MFLLDSSLQVDISFWPPTTLAAVNGEPVELLFGALAASRRAEPPDRHVIMGWAWLYALHVRSALARHRQWQAVQMLAGMREQLIMLSCLRHGLPCHQARGVDQLPDEVLALLADTMPATITDDALVGAYRAAVDLLLDEAGSIDPALATKLRAPLAALRAVGG